MTERPVSLAAAVALATAAMAAAGNDHQGTLSEYRLAATVGPCCWACFTPSWHNRTVITVAGLIWFCNAILETGERCDTEFKRCVEGCTHPNRS